MPETITVLPSPWKHARVLDYARWHEMLSGPQADDDYVWTQEAAEVLAREVLAHLGGRLEVCQQLREVFDDEEITLSKASDCDLFDRLNRALSKAHSEASNDLLGMWKP